MTREQISGIIGYTLRHAVYFLWRFCNKRSRNLTEGMLYYNQIVFKTEAANGFITGTCGHPASQFFSNNLQNNEMLKNADYRDALCYYEVSDGEHIFKDSLTHNGILEYDNWLGLNIQSVFIPTTEMLADKKLLDEVYNM